MLVRFSLIAATLLATGVTEASKSRPALDTEAVRNLCAAVELQSTEMHPLYPGNRYTYQTYFMKWAGVADQDGDVVRNRKIREFINDNMAKLLCNQFNFNPRNGNILKLAVAKQSTNFVRDAVQLWHVDLNQVDAADGKTVLDYISDRRASAGAAFRKTLDRYYVIFRDAGALHAGEIK